MVNFNPGSLIKARGRIWIVLPRSNEKVLRLRPIDADEEENTVILPAIEPVAPQSAQFDWPDPTIPGADMEGALLLKDALTLKLRCGAGSFRSFGSIVVEPKTYQLVPLLMALRQETVRLLIADDVGVGKTIEAGLILRELMDRGEVSKAAVLCPPHLCDQWRSELREHFNIEASILTPQTVRALERSVPSGTLFDFYKFVIVSLDYIKSDEHRLNFISAAPDFIIVDEAHTCASAGSGRQQRFSLLSELAKKESRSLLLLTATPHSGNEKGFYNLLSLLNPKFKLLETADEKNSETKKLREELGQHFVQRRRKDIAEWRDGSVFPTRMQSEITYKLTGEWGQFFDDVQSYCIELANKYQGTDTPFAKQMIWYATLGLLRCAASSPDAAISALSTRLRNMTQEETITDAELSEPSYGVFDGDGETETAADWEPGVRDESLTELKKLIKMARRLGTDGKDPKIAALFGNINELLQKGAHPVVFCRYIATAKYVEKQLREKFDKYCVFSVTGEQNPEERMKRVDESGAFDKRILVATDCLSEGVNLQEYYNSVIHYDLSWNPTRHEQREGRIDRFGQTAPTVWCSVIYGEDNPVDGFILRVILKKTKTIRDELGVYIQPPEEKEKIEGALIKAALMRHRRQNQNDRQGRLFDDLDEEYRNSVDQAEEVLWKDALEKVKRNRTIFAQNRIHPDKVTAQLRKQTEYLGTDDDVRHFVCGVCARLGIVPKKCGNNTFQLPIASLSDKYRTRLQAAGITEKSLKVGFTYPVQDAEYIHRSHPLVSVLAEILLESAIGGRESGLAARTSATPVEGIETLHALFILRLRHKLSYTNTKINEKTKEIVAEELVLLGMKASISGPEFFTDKDLIERLLALSPAGDITAAAAAGLISKAKDVLSANLSILEQTARDRADELLKEHREVRDSAGFGGSWQVEPCLPPDVISVNVLFPAM